MAIQTWLVGVCLRIIYHKSNLEKQIADQVEKAVKPVVQATFEKSQNIYPFEAKRNTCPNMDIIFGLTFF